MATPVLYKGDVLLTESQYRILKKDGTITVGGQTLIYDDTGATRYITEEVDAVIDTAMSDSSINAVRNNVIKQYVDGTKTTLQSSINAKQEKLTAGTGITIENNVISATAQETQIDNTTVTKTADGKLQAVGLQDETDSKTLTAHDIWLACSIEREV